MSLIPQQQQNKTKKKTVETETTVETTNSWDTCVNDASNLNKIFIIYWIILFQNTHHQIDHISFECLCASHCIGIEGIGPVKPMPSPDMI